MSRIRTLRQVPGSIALPLSLLFVAACSGGAAGVEETASAASDAPASDIDAAFGDILTMLDAVYDDEGRPAPSFEILGRVQDVAFDRLQEAPREWPMGTSFSLSTLDDRIFVYVSWGGSEKEGDWFPG